MTTTLSHSPANILRAYLIDQAIVGAENEFEWPSFISRMPTFEEVGDDAVMFTDTPGRLLGRILRTGENPERYGVQIRFRSYDSDKCWRKAKSVQDALDTVLYETITIDAVSYVIQDVNRTSSLMPMGYEEETRLYHVSSNYTITIG